MPRSSYYEVKEFYLDTCNDIQLVCSETVSNGLFLAASHICRRFRRKLLRGEEIRLLTRFTARYHAGDGIITINFKGVWTSRAENKPGKPLVLAHYPTPVWQVEK